MKLPKVDNSQKYTGLYVVDFGDHCGLGFTAPEVAELLESEKFKHITVYKIHNARPDGQMELKGVRQEIFQLEMGMFFYADNVDEAQGDFQKLVDLAASFAPPSRAKIHLAKYQDNRFVTGLIYPAEYNDEFSSWLIDAGYKTSGQAQGGIEAVQRYYDHAPEILRRHQLFGDSSYKDRTGQELLAYTKVTVQR